MRSSALSEKIALFAVVLFAALSGVSSASASAADAHLEIDRIEVTGVTAFTNHEIEEALEIAPGDRLERIKVVRTAENLQAMYRMRGYESVGIQSRLIRRKSGRALETVLEFSISQGRPTKIAWIRFVPDESAASLSGGWSKIEERLTERLQLRPGDLFDQERISEGKRAMQEVLASEERIGAKADDIRVSTTQPTKELLAGTKPGDVARWVGLEIHVDLGDRVSFGFRGNTVFTNAHLSSFVDDQRVIGFGKDYVAAIRARIADEYRALGYALVQIEPYVYELEHPREKHVTYVISEGPRFMIDSLRFDGNMAFSQDELRARFFAKASDLVQHRFYAEKDVQSAADLVMEWIKSRGFLSAKVVTINKVQVQRPKSSPLPPAVQLTIYIYEGDQTLVRSVSVQGATAFSEAEIRSMLGVEAGQPLDLFRFSEGVEALKRAYREKGYLSVKIANEGTDQIVSYSQENRVADIAIGIEEGFQYRVSRIEVEGLTQTKEAVVRRECAFREGEILKESQVTETESRLRRLGIFSGTKVVSMDDPDKPGFKIMRLTMEEGGGKVLTLAAGVRSDLGVRGAGEFAYNNLWGDDHSLVFSGAVNHRFGDFRFYEYQFQAAYMWPWVFWGDTSLQLSTSLAQNQYFTFDANTFSIAANLEKPLLKNPKLFANLIYTWEAINQRNSPYAIDNQEINIGTVTPMLRIDLRDSPLAPTSGLYAMSTFDLAMPFTGSMWEPTPVGYTRFQFRSDYYLPVFSGGTVFLSFRTGLERNLIPPNGNPNVQIPLIKQFALGGPSSVRGYAEEEINIQNIAVQGTASYVNYRSQLDLPVAGSLRFGPFIDAANLNIDTYSLGNLLYGVGVGMHYLTPVGPVNLDWGFKLNPTPFQDPYRIDFSIGVI